MKFIGLCSESQALRGLAASSRRESSEGEMVNNHLSAVHTRR
uniref:Uncharacterized protein n=1 Tax=Anguilla anguilla TaxID=7936 RepID=A0A0E9THN2_ANGAN